LGYNDRWCYNFCLDFQSCRWLDRLEQSFIQHDLRLTHYEATALDCELISLIVPLPLQVIQTRKTVILAETERCNVKVALLWSMAMIPTFFNWTTC
jgi:hypothetical protein